MRDSGMSTARTLCPTRCACNFTTICTLCPVRTGFLSCMQKMRDDKCLGITDSAGETVVSIDMMCMKDLFSVAMFVRKMLVEQSSECENEQPLSEGEASGSESVGEEDW